MSDSPRLCLGCNADLTGTYALRQRCVACVARRDREPVELSADRGLGAWDGRAMP